MSSQLKIKFFLLISILTVAILVVGYFLVRPSSTETSELVKGDAIKVEHVKLNAEDIQIAHAANPEKGLLLLIANLSNQSAVIDYAKKFANLSYYVAILDNATLLNTHEDKTQQCLNLAKKLTTIASQLQTSLKIDQDDLPILVGKDDGAASVYAALAQAEKKQFHAAVGINLPQQLSSHSALCSQEKFTQDDLQTLTPVSRLPSSFYVFQDENSPHIAARNFTSEVGNLKLTQENDTEKAGSEAIQILQWLDPRLADQISSDASDSDLPIIEVTADASQELQTSNPKISDTLAILITGDGGWAAIDKNIARILAEKGIATIGFDALSYFWKTRTPVETTQDIETVIADYSAKWNKKKIILIGYSFGADVLPFIANNLSEENKKQTALVALLGMGKTAAFEFRLSSWMNADKDESRLPILPEIEKMKWAKSICIYGQDDTAANCLPTVELGVKAISMTGDHHFDEKYEELVQHIIDNINTPQ